MKLTLCGSARFEKEFKEWNRRLTLAGHVVYSLAVYPSDAGSKDWYTPAQKDVLDRVHREKIHCSDAIVVVNPDDYIGLSTRAEIVYATALHKSVWYTHHGDRKMGEAHMLTEDLAHEQHKCPEPKK